MAPICTSRYISPPDLGSRRTWAQKINVNSSAKSRGVDGSSDRPEF